MLSKSQWTLVLGGILLLLLYFIIGSLSSIIFPFLMGFIGAYALNGTVTRLTNIRVSRGVGSALVVLAVVMTLIMMMMVFIPFVQQQLLSLTLMIPHLIDAWVSSLKPIVDSFAEKAGIVLPTDIKSHISEHTGDILSWFITIIRDLLGNSMLLANLISLVILTPVIMFYLLKDWPILVSSVYHQIPPRYQSTISSYALRVDSALSNYGRGQLKVCLVLMILYTTTLWAIGINQGVFIGLMTGFMSFIPYVGMIMGLLATLASGFAHFAGWNQIILICIAFAIIGLVEGNILSPRFIGEKVGLHPVWIIFSLLAGATWFGFIGVLVALPTAAIIGVIFRIALESYRNSSFYTGQMKSNGLKA